jgi:DNA-binding NarL/FixJ family response regulator
VRHLDPPQTPPTALAELTASEREVLGLIAAGLSNAVIAAKLPMGVPTAKTHVSRILAKLGARDRAQLVVIAYQPGLVRARAWHLQVRERRPAVTLHDAPRG